MEMVGRKSFFLRILVVLLCGWLLCACGAENTDLDGDGTIPPTAKADPTAGSAAAPSGEKQEAAPMAVIQIETENAAAITSKEQYVKCVVTTENCPEEFRLEDISAQIRVRGNSTAAAEKKPYRLRFDKKQGLLGLNNDAKCKNWCLMADYFDPSMMRTAMAFRLGRTLLGDTIYCSDFTHAEVYINGKYQGVYLVCEQTQINPSRVSIFEKEDGYTGTDIGYLMIGQGGRTDEPNTVQMHANVMVTDLNRDSNGCGTMNFSLAGGDYTQEQIQYIGDWCTAVFEAVHAAIYNDTYYTVGKDCKLYPKTDFAENATKSQKQQQTIGALIDLESAARMYLLDEIVKNLDAATFNMYVDLSPSGNQKLTFAAPWDFDFAFGNTQYETTFSSGGIYAANFSYSEGVRTNPWYVLLNGTGWFRERTRMIWKECYAALAADIAYILEYSDAHAEEYARNYQKWDLLGKKLLYHQHDNVLNFKTQYDAAEFLHDWLTARLEWLNTEWSKEPEDEKIDFTNLNFTDEQARKMIENLNCCTMSAENGVCRFFVTDPVDPYFAISYGKSEETLSADVYRYLEITYRAPAENALKEYTTELFLVAGDTQTPTAGKSVTFSFPADGKFHTTVLDLGETTFWSGSVHTVRIDFYSGCKAGDLYEIQSIRLLKANGAE